MANTPLQNGLGRIYGPGKSLKSEGMIPVWLEQKGSRVMGGLIDLEHKIDGTLKVSAFWPKSIRTATACYELGSHNYCPIPTYRVLEAVSSSDTTVKVAKQDGLPLLVEGMSLASAADTSKKITVDMDDVTIDSTDGYYKITITANTFGALAAGAVLILESAASQVPVGLTKDNLIYDGMDLEHTKLNITLVDEGRVMADTAPVASATMKDALQTVKYENIF